MKYIIFSSLGLMTWPVMEYLLHRFVGHVLRTNTLFKKEHTRHHAETNYFAPLGYKILAAIPVSLIMMSLMTFILNSWEFGLAFNLGFLSMFSVYELVHWSFHAKAPKTQLGLRLRKHHFYHHFHNPKVNHGVTTTFIDKLSKTYIKPGIIKVPKNIILPWLIEKDGQSIKPEYLDHFQLR
jgi:4-hydroxysphinganine ceramide fatty acyl 2-hydroxylase